MAEYAKTSEITPLIGGPADSAILENLTGEIKKEKLEPEPRESLWKETNARQKLLLLFVVLGQFTTYICASLPGPFLARYISDRGGHIIESTVIMQITIFIMAISSAVFGKYQGRIGSKSLLIVGISTFAMCQCLFGLLSYVGNIRIFVTAGILLRAVQGIGHGAYAVASLTLVCQEFPGHIGQVFGITESAVGVGYLTGPMLGSLLYSITDGMLLPFVASGLTLLLTVPAGMLAMKNIQQKSSADGETINTMDFIGNSECFLVLGLATAIYGGYGLYDSTVTIYLEAKSFPVVETGLTLFVSSLSYCVASVIIGYLASLGSALRRTLLVMGMVGFAGGTCLFTPNQTKLWIFVGAAFLGIFGAFTLISCFAELINLAIGKDIEHNSNFALHSALSGTWNFVFGMGTFLYPLAGAEIQKVMPFGISLLLAVIGGYCLALLIAGSFAMKSKCSNGSYVKPTKPES